MEINRIVVQGFKNLDHVELNLNDINGILSVNNYGKSNLLEAIKFGFDFIVGSIKEKQARMKIQDFIPLIKKIYCSNYFLEIEFKLDQEEIIYGFEFKWYQSKENEGKIVKEYLKVKNPLATQKFSLYMERNLDKCLYKTSLGGRCDKDLFIEEDELVINKLRAYDSLFYFKIIDSICNLNFFIDRHFDSNFLYQISPIIEKNYNDLSPMIDDGRGIARALYNLKKEDLHKYNLVINTFKEFFPEVTDVIIKVIDLTKMGNSLSIPDDAPFEFADFAYMLLVKNKYISKNLNFNSMSDGAKRILSVLTCVTLAEKNNIPLIAIEEPENSVHPGLLKKYIDVLKQFTDNSKIILTSHSPNLINYMNLEDLYLGLPNNDGSACFYKLKETYFNRINNYADSMNVMTGEYLFDLMSSYDESDLEDLKKYLKYE